MKVILLKDVAKIGRRGTIVEVQGGYAQNKLLPNKMAKPATKENIKQIEHESEVKSSSQAKAAEDFKKMLAELEQSPLTLSAKTNKEGHLFEALKAEVVAKAIATHTGFQIEARAIHADAPLKSVGQHRLTLAHGGAKGVITITITEQ